MTTTDTRPKIEELEKKMWDLSKELEALRRDTPPIEVKNYTFKTLEGEVSLLDLFAGRDVLFAIHNMGQGCAYCTLWADGFNAFLPHLEDKFAVALLSKDDPETQRRFANSRGWRFRMASHGGGVYLQEQTVATDPKQGLNYPGMVSYIRQGDKVFRKNATTFGPGDAFCSIWPILSMAGFGDENWEAKYNYWKPAT